MSLRLVLPRPQPPWLALPRPHCSRLQSLLRQRVPRRAAAARVATLCWRGPQTSYTSGPAHAHRGARQRTQAAGPPSATRHTGVAAGCGPGCRP
eukprot:366231-Chlamydomonas_euryale.AAC.6